MGGRQQEAAPVSPASVVQLTITTLTASINMSEFEEKAPVEEKEEDTSLANSDVTTKYQEAAKIANATMQEVMAMVRAEL